MVESKATVMRKMHDHLSFKISLPRYGSGEVVFEHSLAGAADANRMAREDCKRQGDDVDRTHH